MKFVYFKCDNSFGNFFAHDHAKDIQNHPDSLGFFVIYKDFMEVTLFDKYIFELHVLFFRKLGKIIAVTKCRHRNFETVKKFLRLSAVDDLKEVSF